MAEEMQPENEEAAAPVSGGRFRKLPGKKMILAAVAALLLAGGGFAAAQFTGILDGVDERADEETISGETADRGATDPVYYELPEFVVNLNTPSRKTTFFKLRAKVELDSGDGIPRIEARMPRIVDRFQVYLRELRPEDLKGSVGTYRLREELLKRLQIDLAPVRVDDILFVEMFVQ